MIPSHIILHTFYAYLDFSHLWHLDNLLNESQQKCHLGRNA